MTTAAQARMKIKAYDLLAAQPVTASGLTQIERDRIVVSAIVDQKGDEHVLSRLGDTKWDLRPFYEQSNVAECFKFVEWPEDLPADMTNDCKAVLYSWFKRGLPGSKAPVARGIYSAATASAFPLMRWLQSLGVRRCDQIRPIHITNYVYLCKVELKLRPLTVYNRLRIIDFLWVFTQETMFPLKQYPWGDSNLWRVSGLDSINGLDVSNSGTGKTAIIPSDDQSLIFNYCEKIIHEASIGLFGKNTFNVGRRSPSLIKLRDCVLYVVSITSGMRNDEAIGIDIDSWRKETIAGVDYCWVATIEHKTGKGKVEYLIPELTINALETLKKYSKALRDELAIEIESLEAKSNDSFTSEELIRLAKARKDSNRIFLCLNSAGNKTAGRGHIEALSSGGSAVAFRRVAKHAGSTWRLSPHQCRRTYARCFVESRMGRSSLVFLKWQFKHSSMSMTQLYASNPMQDLALFDEILEQMTAFKIDLIESWLDDQPLAGGAGRKIMELRAIPIKNRAALLSQTAPHASIRATGHGWCLAVEKGCGGAGLYEATLCSGCKFGVIDENFASTWQGIYSQQLELVDIDDAGPAVRQRAERDLKLAFEVINDLGLSPLGQSDFDSKDGQ